MKTSTAPKDLNVVFAMRYSDDVGYVWKTIAKTRDLCALSLKENSACYIAYPKITNKAAYTPENLIPVEIDFYKSDSLLSEEVTSFLKSRKISCIVYMSASPTTVPLKALRKLKIKTITTENNGFDHVQKDHPALRLAKIVARRWLHLHTHDLHIANSRSQEKFLLNYACLPPNKVRLVSDGVDTSQYVSSEKASARRRLGLNLNDSEFCLLAVSQSRKEKRVDFLLCIFKNLIEKNPDLPMHFFYVGGGPELEHWIALARQLNIYDRVSFFGPQSNLVDYYQAADIFVHAASRESFGLAIVEAMACELPVVACVAAGPKEILATEELGTLVDTNDSKAFVEAIEKHLHDPDARLIQGKLARRHVQKEYSIFRQAQELARCISNVVRI